MADNCSWSMPTALILGKDQSLPFVFDSDSPLGMAGLHGARGRVYKLQKYFLYD